MITAHDVEVCGYIAPIIAAVATIVRLAVRLHAKRFGYDDGLAALSLLILVAFDTGLFVHLGDQTKLSHLNRYAMYYVISQSFYGIIWTARLSILFTVIRISVEGTKIRRFLHIVAASYVIIWMILLAQLLWVCERLPAWKDSPVPQCPLAKEVPIAQLITDIYADTILVLAPLRMLWTLEAATSAQRARLIVAFSASIVTTITSLVHAYYILARPGSLAVIFTAIIELSSSLFVCNMPILVGFFTRLFNLDKWRFPSSNRSESHEMSAGSRFGLRSKSINFRRTKANDSTAQGRTLDIRIDLETENNADVLPMDGKDLPARTMNGSHPLYGYVAEKKATVDFGGSAV